MIVKFDRLMSDSDPSFEQLLTQGRSNPLVRGHLRRALGMCVGQKRDERVRR